MGKTTQQGTRWESRIVSQVIERGRSAMRLPKTGKKNEPDLMIYPANGSNPSLYNMRVAVAWERWLGKKSEGRRTAERMFIMDEDTFQELLDSSPHGWYIQAKSTQSGSVSTWLKGLRERIVKEHEDR